MALICETVTATSMGELRQKRDASLADLVELRLDGVADVDVDAALAGRTRPVVVTCRAAWEGGAFAGSETDRLAILGRAISGGAEFVDVEWKADRRGLPAGGRTRMILSHHDFGGVPVDLASRVDAMRRGSGQGLIKIAVMPSSLRDVVRLRDTIGLERDQIVIGMGLPGLISRACPWLFESAWTYAGTAAPAQPAVADLRDVFRVPRTTAATRIFALTGRPLGHSLSPVMHNAAFAAASMDAVYVPLETDSAGDFLVAADAFGVEGASVTAPLKSAFAGDGVRWDDVAGRIGAINTLTRTPEGWLAQNFDVEAFVLPLTRRGLPLAGARVVVVGAGGAARAAVSALVDRGAHVGVCARRADAAAALAAALGVAAVEFPLRGRWDLIVNATPVGTWPEIDVSPLEYGRASADVVYDLVYNPPETALRRAARAAGARTIGGLEMLVEQAEAQFARWMGEPAPAGAMAAAAGRALGAEFRAETRER